MLFAPWGDPRRWSKVDYSFNRYEEPSWTSLSIIRKVISPDKLIIFGLDTLAEEGSSYDEVTLDARNRIREHAERYGLRDFEIIISPGVGRFSNGIFIGSMLDYYYYILEKIVEFILGNCDGKLEVYLDLTHGINFMPVLTYRAVKEVLESAALFMDIKFTVYNADPYVKNVSDKLSINIVEEDNVSPRPLDTSITAKFLSALDLSIEEREEIFSRLDSLLDIHGKELSAFVGSIYNGLPLAVFTFYPEKGKMEKNIQLVLHTYKEHILVKHRDILEVKRRLAFTEGFRAYVISYLLAKLLEESDIINKRKEEASIDELKHINKKLFRSDRRLNIRIDDDLHYIDKNLEEREVNEWEIYSRILEKPVGEPDSRNFLAHSGFERNLIELKKDGHGKVWVRYKKDRKNLNIIKNFCSQGLKRKALLNK